MYLWGGFLRRGLCGCDRHLVGHIRRPCDFHGFRLNGGLLLVRRNWSFEGHFAILGDDLDVVCGRGQRLVRDYGAANPSGQVEVRWIVFLLVGGRLRLGVIGCVGFGVIWAALLGKLSATPTEAVRSSTIWSRARESVSWVSSGAETSRLLLIGGGSGACHMMRLWAKTRPSVPDDGQPRERVQTGEIAAAFRRGRLRYDPRRFHPLLEVILELCPAGGVVAATCCAVAPLIRLRSIPVDR